MPSAVCRLAKVNFQMARINSKIISAIIILILFGTGGWFGFGKITEYKKNNSKSVSIENIAENKSQEISESPRESSETKNDIGNIEQQQIKEELKEENISEEKVIAAVRQDEKEEKENKTETKKTGGIIQNLVSWGYASSKSRSIDTIIIHSSYDAIGNKPYDTEGLIKEYKQYGVAAHYLIDRKGVIYRLVADENIAYHAGESKVPDGRTNVNNFSLGIELMNTEKDSYTSAQYDSLNNLISKLKKNYKIKYVLGHKDIAPGRKADPWGLNWDKVRK